MGEEVRDPQRTIPRAIPIALLVAVAVYLVVGAAALMAAGPHRLADATAPLTVAVQAAGAGGLAPVVRVGAALASLGALLALIAGSATHQQCLPCLVRPGTSAGPLKEPYR